MCFIFISTSFASGLEKAYGKMHVLKISLLKYQLKDKNKY